MRQVFKCTSSNVIAFVTDILKTSASGGDRRYEMYLLQWEMQEMSLSKVWTIKKKNLVQHKLIIRKTVL